MMKLKGRALQLVLEHWMQVLNGLPSLRDISDISRPGD